MPPAQEMEQITALPPPQTPPTTTLLRIVNTTLLCLSIGGAFLLRLYFLRGGTRLWLSTFLQMAGCPILLIPISVSSYIENRRPFQLPSSAFAASAVIGLLVSLGAYLYSYGTSYLPFSTSSILMASQLAFTALSSFVIVRQRFTAYSVNAVVLLTLGPVVLGLGASKDQPVGVSNGKYILGFVMSLLAAALMGLLLPVMERMYKMAKQGLSYGMVMELQLVVGLFATGFSLVGMAINKDFQAIAREAKKFELGEVKYYTVLVCAAILFQFSNLGLFGVIFCSSSLFASILTAVILPLSEILAVFFFHEKFDGSKGIALILCLWGFTSYLYGERKKEQKVKKFEVEIPSMP